MANEMKRDQFKMANEIKKELEKVKEWLKNIIGKYEKNEWAKKGND